MVVVAAWHRSVSGSQGPVDSEPDDRRGRRFPCGPDTATSGYIFGKPLLVKIARFRSQKKQAIKDSAFRKNPLIFTVQHGRLLCPPCADRFPISVRLGGSRETGALTFEGLLTREKRVLSRNLGVTSDTFMVPVAPESCSALDLPMVIL